MSVERFGSKTDAIVKLVLVFFVALLSFSIGTFVGKKFSDNQHKMAQMEPGSEEGGEHNEATTHGDAAKHDEATKEGDHGDTANHEEASADHGAANESGAANEHGAKDEHGDRNVASVSADAHDVKPEKALSDEEISKLAEEFVVDDKKEATKGHGKEETAHEERKVASEKAHESKEPAPAIPSSASRIPSALPKEVAASSTLGKYTVQVASYPSEQEAQKRAAELKEKGFSAFYITAKIKNQTWYRVNVGLFTTQKEADAYKKDLVSKAQVSSPIVQKLSNIE